MQKVSSIFKTFDIRGLYKKEINSNVITKIAYSYVTEFKPSKVVLGFDAREGSIHLASIFKKNLLDLGVDVVNVGMVSTPRLYYSSFKCNIPFGVMFTASHEPKEYVGLKFTIKGLPPSKDKLLSLKKRFLSLDKFNFFSTSSKRGKYEFLDISKDYVNDVLSFDNYSFKPFNIVVDCGNSVNSDIVHKIFNSGLSLNSTYILYDTVDSSFPSHGLNPKELKNQKPLARAIKKYKADLGILWDGDADRVYFLDSFGNAIPPQFVAAIVGSYMVLNDKNRKKVVVDIRTGSIVKDLVEKSGGVVKVVKAWHTELKYAMQKDSSIIFGSETSGHYVFRDFYKIDDGLLMSLMFLQAVSQNRKTLKNLLSFLYKRYFVPEEANFIVPNTQKLLDLVLNKYKSLGSVILLDGVSIKSSDWYFNLRPSKTEPLLRLNFSGTSTYKVKEFYDDLLNFITFCGGSLVS